MSRSPALLLNLLVLCGLLLVCPQRPGVALGPGAGSEPGPALQDGLVVYYSFDDGTATDISGYGHHGTIYGTPEVVTGVRGTALQFGGYYHPDYIVVPNSEALSFLDNLTFSLWFNINSHASENGYGNVTEYGSQNLIGKSGDRTGLGIRVGRSTQDNLWYPYVHNGGCNWSGGCGDTNYVDIAAQAGSGAELHEWHMVSATHGDGSVRLYVDAVLQGELSAEEFKLNPRMAESAGYLAQELSGAYAREMWYPLDGALDEIRIYNRALSEAEIQALYHQFVVGEARLDMGMPYDANRGCSSPYVGCGGPHHGFYAGVCTDLVYDAYLAGFGADLRRLIAADAVAHPCRYYHPQGNSRDAEDQRRYYLYNQQYIEDDADWRLGDVAFFDMTGARQVANHVAIISEVKNDRPSRMIHASGTDDWDNWTNAWEQDLRYAWPGYQPFYLGHGRIGPAAPPEEEPCQGVRITGHSPFNMRLWDNSGRFMGYGYDPNSFAGESDALLPYLRGAGYVDNGPQVLTMTIPVTGTYQLELLGTAQGPYAIDVETFREGVVSATQTYTGNIDVGQLLGMQLSVPTDQELVVTPTNPTSVVGVEMPAALWLTNTLEHDATARFTVRPLGALAGNLSVSMAATDLVSHMGHRLSSDHVIISPSVLALSAGGAQTVTVTINTPGPLPAGDYLGRLVLVSDAFGTRLTPITLHATIRGGYLPRVVRGCPRPYCARMWPAVGAGQVQPGASPPAPGE